jgi:molecular chaperone DnaK (HSP70)
VKNRFQSSPFKCNLQRYTTAMSEAGLTPADIKAVELVGNASRMPFISTQLEVGGCVQVRKLTNAVDP